MSVNTSALSQYVEVNSASLLHKGLLASRTVQLVDMRGGIKSKSHTFSIDSTTLVVQAANCGLIPSGTTTIAPITIDIDRLAVRESVCQDTLEDYFETASFKAGQNRDDNSMSQVSGQYIAEKVMAIGNEIDRLLWQGNKTTGTGNLLQTDGYLATFKSVSASTQNIAKTALTESNAIAVCKAYFDTLPSGAKTRDDLTMFMGHDEFIMLKSALIALNMNDDKFNADEYSLKFGFRPMKIEAVTGLNGTNRKIVGPRSFMKAGTDLASDMPAVNGQSGLRFWFSNDDEIHYFQSRWAQGVGVGFPAFFVNDLL